MEIKVTKKIGNNTMEFVSTEQDFKIAMAEIVPFTQPDICSLCKKTRIIFETNKASTDEGTFIYVKRKCLDCGAQSTLGEYKGGGYFWKEFEIYQPNVAGNKKQPAQQQTQQQAPAPQTQQEPPQQTNEDISPEDIGF